jgi:tannase/feruloyl esterase
MRKLILPVVIAAIFAPATFAAQSCESLASLSLARVVIHSAVVDESPLRDPARPDAPPVTIPKRCIVKGVAKPTLDSEIKFEVWMPVQGWNGKYRQAGNGGWAGSIPVQALGQAVRLGYATAATDDGHEGGSSASWAIGHPEKLIDFGHRAVHQTSVQAKAIIRAFYGSEASRSYFVGCSDGGREALMEAQRYPEDFDGIIAGAPANYWSHHFTGFVWNEQALLKEPGSAIPPAKLEAIQNAALAACDALDGV